MTFWRHDDIDKMTWWIVIVLQGNSVMVMIIFDYWKGGAFVVFKSHAFVCWKLQDSHCCHFALSRSTVWKAGGVTITTNHQHLLLHCRLNVLQYKPHTHKCIHVQIPPPQLKIPPPNSNGFSSHWNKVALTTASWVYWFLVAFSLLFWQNTTRTHSPHFFLPKQSHIRHNSYFLTVRPTFSSLWYGIVWNEIYQLWIYWTELIYKSSPQHLMGGWVRLTCKTICFYWSSSCGLTLTQWKPAIT